MADDTNQQGAADRDRVAANEGYEVAYFAQKHGLTRAAARDLIAEVGNDRDKLDAAAAARAPATAKTSPPRRSGVRSGPRTGTTKPSSTPGRATAAPKRQAAARPGLVDKAATVAARIANPVGDGAETVRRRVIAATKPVADAAAPVAKAIASRTREAVATARRSSASARKRVAAAPARLGRRADQAIDATRAAVTSRTATLIGVAAAGLVTGLAVNLGRKAIVQAPGVMAGDWFEALKIEHGLALAIFDQIEKTTDGEPARRTSLLTQLKHALGKHAFTEENVIYPALRDWGDKADADKLNHDHGYVKQYLYELGALESSSPAFRVRAAAFRADLEAHIREEEDAIFPPLHAALGDAKNAEITALANKEGFKLA